MVQRSQFRMLARWGGEAVLFLLRNPRADDLSPAPAVCGATILPACKKFPGGLLARPGGNSVPSGGDIANRGGSPVERGGNHVQLGGTEVERGGNVAGLGGNAVLAGGSDVSSGGDAVYRGGNAVPAGGKAAVPFQTPVFQAFARNSTQTSLSVPIRNLKPRPHKPHE